MVDCLGSSRHTPPIPMLCTHFSFSPTCPFFLFFSFLLFLLFPTNSLLPYQLININDFNYTDKWYTCFPTKSSQSWGWSAHHPVHCRGVRERDIASKVRNSTANLYIWLVWSVGYWFDCWFFITMYCASFGIYWDILLYMSCTNCVSNDKLFHCLVKSHSAVLYCTILYCTVWSYILFSSTL